VVVLPRSHATGWLNGEPIYTGTDVPSLAQFIKPEIPFTMYDTDGIIIEHQDVYDDLNTALDIPITDPYALMVIPVTNQGFSVRRLTTAERNGAGVSLGVGYNLFRYPRISTYLNSSSGARILGAGSKLQATAPPLMTGGYCYAGSVKPKDLFKTFQTEIDGLINDPSLINGPWLNFKNFLMDRKGFKATQGVTARYVPLNDKYQLDFHATTIPFPPFTTEAVFAATPAFKKRTLPINRFSSISSQQSKYNHINPHSHKNMVNEYENKITDIEELDGIFIKDKYNTTLINKQDKIDKCTGTIYDNIKNIEQRHKKYKSYLDNRKSLADKGLTVPPSTRWEMRIKPPNFNSVAKQDLCNPDDPVPCLWFQYSPNPNADATEQAFSIYPLEFRSRVHIENEPDGDTALICRNPVFDPSLKVVEEWIANSTNVPIAASGNSFRTIMSKIGQMAGHVGKWASRAEKVAKILMG